MPTLTPEILASQAAYVARPFAVTWVDSHSSGTFRFHTFNDAFDYVQAQWQRIQRDVSTYRYRASNLWRSRLETPEGSISVAYFLLTSDVSSY